MAWKLTDDGLAYRDEDTGLEHATPPTGSIYPTGVFRQLWAYLALKLFGRDATPPVNPGLRGGRNP